MQKAADDGLLGPIKDLDYATLWATASIEPHDTRLDAVLVQDRAHLVRGQIDVGFTVITLHETVSIAMSKNRSFNFIQQSAGLAKIFDMISFFLKFKT